MDQSQNVEVVSTLETNEPLDASATPAQFGAEALCSQGRVGKARAWMNDHRHAIMAAFAAIAVLVLIIGLTLTWFVRANSASTVGKIQAPAVLKVLGPNGTATTMLDITGDSESGDSKDANGKVHRLRAFSVESNGSAFELRVANTTNIKGLEIHIYRAKECDTSDASNADVAGLDGNGNKYAWKKGAEVTGFTPINDENADGIANTPSAGDATFGDYVGNEKVQKNAAPLYRYKTISESELDDNGKYTNYIIECTWTETDKETDVVYLIAGQAQAASSNANGQ